LILEDADFQKKIEDASLLCIQAFKNAKKVMFCGNGGSAADAQHLSAELSGRYYIDRPPLPSEALHVNSSYLTAVANDYSYDEVYARLVRGSMEKGDVLIGLSTSGNSKNIIKAFAEAKTKGISIVGLTGESGGQMKEISDILLNVPSTDTPRVQESHILIGHIICELIERELFLKNKTS
jgi:D-sedoheptulose 7-phosphate isomerase